ncbi:MAG: lipopolysaccharide heptosyltransferase II [Phycisphaerae bacterium]
MVISAEKLLVVLPNWVGDAVLATPALRAIRNGFPNSKISYLIKPYLSELFSGCRWYDELVYWPGTRKGFQTQTAMKLLRQLRTENFDLAVLLANSFRSALTCSLGKIPRRVGYDRDGRGVMLTDKLLPDRYNGRFLPISALKYYLSVADYLGCPTDNYHLELFTKPECESEVDGLLLRHGLKTQSDYALINPGASYGPAKCWPAEYFARVGDHLAERYKLQVLVVCGPREVQIAKSVVEKMSGRGIALIDPVAKLGTLKALIRRSKILVTNDTGPRHFAAAFNIPVVTIFGPTDPRWSETLYVRERQVRNEVDCGPCMKRACPEKHHRCMADLKPDRVTQQVDELLLEKEEHSLTVVPL